MFSTPFAFMSAPAGGFSPINVPNLVGWWDSEVNVVKNPTFVNTWTDIVSGNVATSSPNSTDLTTSGTLNGHVGISSPGGKAFTLASNLTGVDVTIFSVFKNAASSGIIGYLLGDTTSMGVITHIIGAYGGPGIGIYQDPMICIGGTNNDLAQYGTFQKTGSTSLSRQNGAQVATTGGNINAFIFSRIFDGNGTLTFSLNGTIWEILFYNRALTNSEILQVEDYLSIKYGF